MEISNENTRKIWIMSIIGILSLILLTIGATYAYFTFSSDNQFGSQTIEATTEAIGSGVTLTKVGEPLTLDVSALEMLEKNIGTSYYASGSSTPAQIGKIQVAGEGTFICTYTMTVSATSTSEDKNLYTKFQNFANKSEGQIYLDINDTRYDFNTANLFPITYNGTIDGIDSSADQYITANMTIVNNELDQTVLNDGDISLTFEVTEFDCELDESKTASEEIMAMNPSGLNTTLEGGLYRYQGTNDTVNNYLCFGYSNYETDCDFTNADNSDKYAYRIIGINTSGQLKLIKKEALNTAYAWNSSAGVTWNTAELYTNLNGSYFYSNTTYVPESWKNKIALTTWKYGDITDVNITADELYNLENGFSSVENNYIGLMYANDYYYAYQSGGLNCVYQGQNSSTCKSAWLHLSNNDSSAPNTAEWVLPRNAAGYGYVIVSGGGIGKYAVFNTNSVRPVFFLNADVALIDGTGQSSDPFIIQ